MLLVMSNVLITQSLFRYILKLVLIELAFTEAFRVRVRKRVVYDLLFDHGNVFKREGRAIF